MRQGVEDEDAMKIYDNSGRKRGGKQGKAGRGGGRGNSNLKTPHTKKQAPLQKKSSRASAGRASSNLRRDADKSESLDDSKDGSYEEEDEEEDHDTDDNVVFMRLVNSFVVFVGALACCSAALVVIVVVLTLFCNAEPLVQNRKRSTPAQPKNDKQNKKLKSTGKLERLLCSKEHHPMFLDCIQAIFSAFICNG